MGGESRRGDGESDWPARPAGFAENPQHPGSSTVGLTAGGEAGDGDPGSTEPDRLRPGEQLAGRFTILRFVARGGMGTVYEANDVMLHSHVALKVVGGRLATDVAAMERFRREVLLARRVSHPNVCRVHEIHQATTAAGASIHFFTMEYLEGETLTALIRRQGRLPVAEALPLVEQMCDGLGAAHAQGVIHRDFKSSNVMLVPRPGEAPPGTTGPTRVVITDFGIAHVLDPGDGEPPAPWFTDSDGLVGTPSYMAPEQVTGGLVTPATDLYALGVVMYEMVSGKLPFSGDSPMATAARRIDQPPPNPQQVAPGLEPRWSRVILRCLEREPGRRFASADDVRRAVSGTRRNRLRPGLFLAAGLLLIAAAIVARKTGALDRPATPPRATLASTAPSIAVLPFVDMSANHDQGYFSDGVAEEIINALAQVPGLHVAARSSSFSFKGKSEDLRDVARKLDVAHLLEGSIRTSGNRLRVTAQLVSASDGYQLWSQTFDRDAADMFAVQDEISRAVVTALKLKVLPGSLSVERRGTSPQAYAHYLRGLYLRNLGSLEAVRSAIEEYRQAIASDADYAPAYAALSEAMLYGTALNESAGEPSERERPEVSIAERAVALDPTLADGHAARGRVRMLITWDWAGAQQDLEHAIALAPGNANAQLRYGQMMETLGRLPEALALLQQVVELDPLSATANQQLGICYTAMRDFAAARKSLQRALELAPGHGLALRALGLTELLDGRPAEALAIFQHHPQEWIQQFGIALAEHSLGNRAESQKALDRVIAMRGNAAQFQIAQIHAWRGERDLAFDWLERARERRHPGLSMIKYTPLLAGLRSDPRYAALLEKLRLPPG
jgi:serine/threonine protein kinase/Tfp pilus assembly protein PilF